MTRELTDDPGLLLDPETWETPDHLTEDEWRAEAGPGGRRGRPAHDDQGERT